MACGYDEPSIEMIRAGGSRSRKLHENLIKRCGLKEDLPVHWTGGRTFDISKTGKKDVTDEKSSRVVQATDHAAKIEWRHYCTTRCESRLRIHRGARRWHT